MLLLYWLILFLHLIQKLEDYFIVTLENQLATQKEIIKVTSRNGDFFTVVREQENTTPFAWPQQTLVDLRETAGTLQRLQHIINDEVEISIGSDDRIRITSTEPFAPRSTQLWVGGLRQKLGVDYIEEFANVLKIQYSIDQNDFNNGLNIVLDFHRA